MKPLHRDVADMADEMQRVGERMEATGRRLNRQVLITHAAEVQNAAHMARTWAHEIEKEIRELS